MVNRKIEYDCSPRKAHTGGTIRIVLLTALLVTGPSLAASDAAGDWPMWRGDAGRTAASNQSLPAEMQLQWTRVYSQREQVWDDPLNHDLMPYDKIFEPIVKNGRMIVGFNDTDEVVALDVADGSKLWSFRTDGPVRFPAVAWQDNVFFTSDDGHLYCLNASDGQLVWRFRGGPNAQKVIGNGRLISAWPARGGPVIADGDIYFAASIWPFMGTFIYSLDAATGQINWKNDSTSFHYIKQPHSAPSFAGVAPQGAMVVVGDHLLVPGGRSVPAALDRHTGELLYFKLNAGGKGNGGSLVLGRGDEYYVHTRRRGVRAYQLANGTKTAFMTNEPVLADDRIYAAETVEEKGRADRHMIRAYNLAKELVWQMEADGRGDLILAGNRLFAANDQEVFAVRLPERGAAAKVVWSHPVQGKVLRLLAAENRLFAVTLDGKIHAFGRAEVEPTVLRQQVTKHVSPPDTAKRAKELASVAEGTQGYVLWFGADDPELLDAVLESTQYHVVVIDPDAQRVDQLRERFDARGYYGDRVTVHVGDPISFKAPRYIARLVVLGSELVATADTTMLQAAYASVRPYGGALIARVGRTNDVLASQVAEQFRDQKFEQAHLTSSPGRVTVRRVGALPGAADWTHQYGNIANTVKSDDQRVKLPLGLLWFGGSSNMDVLPRHGHGPPEQVIGGRVFIEGMNSLSCRDVYTGQVLWKREFEDLGTYDIYYDETYRNTPLDPSYNQVHIPGANGRGTNFVATGDAVYLAIDNQCLVLDVATGETIQTIALPPSDEYPDREWGYIGVYKDVLIGGAGFANYRSRQHVRFPEDDELSGNRKGYGGKSFDVSASAGLVAFDRKTGDLLWEMEATHSYLHNGIVAADGKVFVLDKLPKQIESKLKRRGLAWPDTYRISAVDYRTGEPIWEVSDNIFGTWLGYSEQYHLLLQAGAAASDRLYSEVGTGMAVYRGDDGSVVWKDLDRAYSGPCILHNDLILTNANSYQLSAGAFSLLDGTPKLIANPLTGQKQPWQLCRAYGCNSIIASEHLLTFRSGAAGFYDMTTLSGTGNLGGFKSSCTSNLVVANGVLNAPDYTRTCSCAYQNQTSLALIHMPEMEMWTINHEARLSKPGQEIQRIGVNFGAPGDRVDPDGTLWIDYPFVGGQSAELEIVVDGQQIDYFAGNSLAVSGRLPWVAASGVRGAQRIVVPLTTKPPPSGLRFSPQKPNDDAEQYANGDVVLESSDLELVHDSSQQTVGIRFPNVTIPRGVTIQSAYIQFTSDETSDVETKLRLRAEATSDAKPFSSARHDVTRRATFDTQVQWQPKPWKQTGRAGGAQRTPDLASLVQAVVNQPDWQAGNALAVLIDGQGKRVAEAYSGANRKQAAQLVVEADLPPEPAAAAPPKRPHTVRLHFMDPDSSRPGQRVVDVYVQDEKVFNNLDIFAEAGQASTSLVKELRGVPLYDQLEIRLVPQQGRPIISGVEVVRESLESAAR